MSNVTEEGRAGLKDTRVGPFPAPVVLRLRREESTWSGLHNPPLQRQRDTWRRVQRVKSLFVLGTPGPADGVYVTGKDGPTSEEPDSPARRRLSGSLRRDAGPTRRQVDFAFLGHTTL